MQREMEAAAADEVIKYLKPMVKANPSLQVAALNKEHMKGIAVAAVAGFVKKKAELEIREELNDPLPNNMLGL